MKSFPLLSHSAKIAGIVLFIPALILSVLVHYFGFQFDALTIITHPEMPYMNTQNLTDEIALTLLIVSLLLITFSREKVEDEFIYHLRLSSLLWSFMLYYIILLIAVWILYDEAFLNLMIYHLFMPIVFYLVLFRIRLYKAIRN